MGFVLRTAAAVAVLQVLAAQATLAATSPQEADLLLYNGKIITVDEKFSIQTSLAVKDGRIVAVGGQEIDSAYTPKQKIDLGGRVLMPGFNDTHIHIQSRSFRAIDMAGVKSIADIQERVRRKAAELGAGQWITGFGWDEALLAEKRNIVRGDLDIAAPNNPVALTRAGGHSIVGNSMALRVAKIDRNTADPQSGLIEKDEKGEPNGIIRERSDLYLRNVPRDKWEDMRGGYVETMKWLLTLGITSVHTTASIEDEPVGKGGVKNPGPGLTFRRYQAIAKEFDVPRAALYINYPGAERLAAFPYHTGYGDDRVRLGAIGESAVDGGFTGPTAWTLVDYKGMPGFRGKGRFTDEQLQEMVDNCARLGWQMGLHAIGDAAIVQTVNAYSKAIRTVLEPGTDHRWFLDHFTIMPPDSTMQVMAEDDIHISQQPNFLYNLEGRYVETMDDWRVRHNNSIGTPAKKFGLHVAFGSDNLPIGPMVGLYAAVTRKGMTGTMYGPEEAVSMAEAIRMYTANGAYLTWEERIKGTLEVGKLADMIVLEADPLTIDASKLLTTKVDLTFLGGKLVYDRKAAAATATTMAGTTH
jgi:predicted amidohydrolase YtcJ